MDKGKKPFLTGDSLAVGAKVTKFAKGVDEVLALSRDANDLLNVKTTSTTHSTSQGSPEPSSPPSTSPAHGRGEETFASVASLTSTAAPAAVLPTPPKT